MELILYKTNDAVNVINKTLTDSETLYITLKRDTDILNPVIYLTPEQGLDYFDFNYCEITELKRKYFISCVEMVNNQLYRLDCSCDYLETYKAGIIASNARFVRPLKTGDYLPVNLEFSEQTTVTSYESSAGFDGERSLILTSIGGSAT
jgi:hypothetical protein